MRINEPGPMRAQSQTSGFGQQIGQGSARPQMGQQPFGPIGPSRPPMNMGGGMTGPLINRLPQRTNMGGGGIEPRSQNQMSLPIFGPGSPAHKRIIAEGGQDPYAKTQPQMQQPRMGMQPPQGIGPSQDMMGGGRGNLMMGGGQGMIRPQVMTPWGTSGQGDPNSQLAQMFKNYQGGM